MSYHNIYRNKSHTHTYILSFIKQYYRFQIPKQIFQTKEKTKITEGRKGGRMKH